MDDSWSIIDTLPVMLFCVLLFSLCLQHLVDELIVKLPVDLPDNRDCKLRNRIESYIQ